MKCAIYSRVSTNKQENENQLIQLREFAAKMGWDVVTEYVDVVTASGKKNKLHFDQMMQAASQRQFDVLLFWKLDRLSREGVRRTLTYLSQLDSYGVAWRSFTEQYFDSCGIMRDAVISIMATLAQQERLNISERTKAGLRRVKAKGIVLGRPTVNVDMVKVRLRQTKGESLRQIARSLKVSPALLVKRLQA